MGLRRDDLETVRDGPALPPVDLLLISVWVLAALGSTVYISEGSWTVVRVLVCLPLILVIPGYLTTCAFFPFRDDLEGMERFGLSVGLSIILVPLMAFALNFTPFGVQLATILIAIVAFSMLMVVAIEARRTRIPVNERYSFTGVPLIAALRQSGANVAGSRLNVVVAIVLAGLLLATAGVATHLIPLPSTEQLSSEFYLLGPNGTATDFPKEVVSGVPQDVVIGIGNHERRAVSYTVEVFALNETIDNTSGRPLIRDMVRLTTFSATLADSTARQWNLTYTVTNLTSNKVEFLLFRDAAPTDQVWGADRFDQSYRSLYLWTTVQPTRLR
jgi:uncharacterized membrane protein